MTSKDMTSKEKMLGAIRQNKPAALPLPEPFAPPQRPADPVATFAAVLGQIGGHAVEAADLAEVKVKLTAAFPEARSVVSRVPGLDMASAALDTKAELERLEVALLPGAWGVAENGAVWVDEAGLVPRALPFICQHLGLVLSRKHLLATMHDAYRTIRINETGYGVFIAGPSKTADIEQSLVIGAHGPRSLTVFLLP